jgi:hypothetical protein
MPQILGFKFNRMYEVSYVAGDLATSWVAVQIESTQANPVCVYGVDFSIIFPSAADRDSFVQHEVVCFRDLKLQLNGVAAAAQADQSKEEIWGLSSTEGGKPVSFDEPLELEPGYTYTFVLFPALFDPALAGTARATLTVRGDMLPWMRRERNPIELKTGTAEKQPDCVAVAES